jgi:signal transduction histidine kinase
MKAPRPRGPQNRAAIARIRPDPAGTAGAKREGARLAVPVLERKPGGTGPTRSASCGPGGRGFESRPSPSESPARTSLRLAARNPAIALGAQVGPKSMMRWRVGRRHRSGRWPARRGASTSDSPSADPGDELRNLADTVDGLLERLDSAFDAQKRFVANAAHELRTPLTLEHALLEESLLHRDSDTPAGIAVDAGQKRAAASITAALWIWRRSPSA